jgi:predicted XRE-type DNA-binding protein
MADELVARIKRFMEENRVTQSEGADVLGITQGHLSKVLAGRTPLVGRTRREFERLLRVGRSKGGLAELCRDRAERICVRSRLVMEIMQKWITEVEAMCDSVGASPRSNP